jgi:hypothetical protein
MDKEDDNIYLKIGKQMYENIALWNFNNDYIIINKKSYDDYRIEYINKLNVQIELLEKAYNKICNEIEELERKNLELFVNITKEIKLKYQKNKIFGLKNINSNKSFTFNIFNSVNSLDCEKYKLNLITINKLKTDQILLHDSLEKTKSYKIKYEN